MSPPIQILLNGTTDITSYVVTYQRNKEICTGVGNLTLEVSMDAPTIDLWDSLTLYESSNKKGVYYVITPNLDLKATVITIQAQDASKKLMDYFIPDIYSLSYPTTARYWIEFFLNEAGVPYNFNTVSNGSTLSENMSFGPSPAFDVITQLLQTSAWFMYFDADGVCQIGTQTIDLTGDFRVATDHDILSLTTSKTDKIMRNRAVVWGNFDPSSNSWVFTDQERLTGYEYDSRDKRTVVVANSFIRNNATAVTIADKLLDELAIISYEKTLVLEGDRNLELGDILSVQSNYFTGEGRVTAVGSSISSSEGLRTTVVLDTKCPRMFGYYSYISHVYTGTDGAGIYRKEIDTGNWESFSTGLNDYNIKDLMIKNGVFACIAGDYCYTNIGHRVANWTKYQHPDFTDLDGNTHIAANVEAVAVDIDAYTLILQIGYRTKMPDPISGEYRSWIVELRANHTLIDIYQIYVQGFSDKQDFRLLDSEKGPKHKLTSSEAPANYGSVGGWGTRDVNETPEPEPNAHTFGIIPSASPINDAVAGGGHLLYDNFAIPERTVLDGTTAYSSTIRGFAYTAWSGDTAFAFTTHWHFDIGHNLGQYGFNIYYAYGMGFHIDSAFDENGDDVLTRKYRIAEFSVETDVNGFPDYSELNLFSYSLTPLVAKYPVQSDVHLATTEGIILSGHQSIDGVMTQDGWTVLVKDQLNSVENGIYIPRTGDWVRLPTVTMTNGVICGVEAGNTNLHTFWQIPDGNVIVQGIDAVLFQQVLEISVDFSSNYFTRADSVIDTIIGEPKMSHGICYQYLRIRSMVYDVLYSPGYGDPNPPPPYLIHPRRDKWEHFLLKFDMEENSLEFELIQSDEFYVKPNQPNGDILTLTNLTELLPMNNGYGVVWFNQFNLVSIPSASIDFGNPDFRTILHCVWGDKDGFHHNTSDFLTIYPIIDPCIHTQDITSLGGYIEPRGNAIIGNTTESYIKAGSRARRSDVNIFDPLGDNCCNTITGAYSNFVKAGIVTLPSLNIITEYNGGLICEISGSSNPGEPCEVSCGDGPGFDPWSTDELNYIPYYGHIMLTSRTGSPQYVFENTRDVYDSFALTGGFLFTIGPPGVICKVLDELDNGIYLYNPDISVATIYKDIGGSLVAEIYAGFPFQFSDSFVFSNQIFIVEYTNSNTTIGVSISKLKDEYFLQGQKLCFVTKQRENIGCTFADFDFFGLRLENSINTNLMSYTENEPMISYSYGGNTFTSSDLVPLHVKMYTLSYNSGIIYETVNDIRSTYFGGATVSGSFFDWGEYMFVTTNEGLLKFIELNPNLVDFQDYIHLPYLELDKLETSNYYNPQYDFVSVSGVEVAPNIAFFQKNPGSLIPIDYTVGGPSLPITSVRLDDRM